MTSSRSSNAPTPLSQPSLSTISWKIPEPTDVLHYVYLWSHEAEAGEDNGRKDRPVVVVLARSEPQAGRHVISVAPITHSEPEDPSTGVLIPPRVKKALGLDGEKSWIIVDEINVFTWPGPDVRPRKGGDGSPYYGQIPAALYEQVKTALIAHYRSGEIAQTKRSA